MINDFKRTIFLLVICLLFSLLGEQAFAIPSLRMLAEGRGIEIRTAVTEGALLDDYIYAEALGSQFNMASPELSLLFRNVHPAPNTYDFTYSDLVVNFAEDNGMNVNGHTLVWYAGLPDWVIYGSWTRDELIAVLEDHIKTVVGHFKGRIKSWDVLNEAVERDGSLRNTIWLRTIGPEYIDMAFQWAHEADPDAQLFYKDFGISGEKADGIYELVSDLVQRGVPIHGVNMQMHPYLPVYSENLLDVAAYNMIRLSELGLEVNITEFEVPLYLPADAEELSMQASIYGEFLHLCLCANSCKVFETWGFTDLYSWIPLYSPGWGAALMTDENYMPKPAFYALVDEFNAVYDADTDGIPDDNGTCTRIKNPCTGGETTDCYDNCPATPNPDQADMDNDGVGDVCDNCVEVANIDQRDTNSGEDDNTSLAGIQHYGNICDPDFNDDGLVDSLDFIGWLIFRFQTVPPGRDDIDLDGDGFIGLQDLNFLFQYYNSTPGPGAGD
jgi:endo-1,4-beta-xylanase